MKTDSDIDAVLFLMETSPWSRLGNVLSFVIFRMFNVNANEVRSQPWASADAFPVFPVNSCVSCGCHRAERVGKNEELSILRINNCILAYCEGQHNLLFKSPQPALYSLSPYGWARGSSISMVFVLSFPHCYWVDMSCTMNGDGNMCDLPLLTPIACFHFLWSSRGACSVLCKHKFFLFC